jgi:hypothetical protein
MAWLGEVLFLGVDVGVGCRSVVMVVIGLVVVILDVGWVGRVQYAILAAFFCFLRCGQSRNQEGCFPAYRTHRCPVPSSFDMQSSFDAP